jgi:two-component system, cell cycle response regulator
MEPASLALAPGDIPQPRHAPELDPRPIGRDAVDAPAGQAWIAALQGAIQRTTITRDPIDERAAQDWIAILQGVVQRQRPHLARHQLNVARLAHRMGRRLNLDRDRHDVLVWAAELHDVGLVAIAEEVGDRPAPLSDPERNLKHASPVSAERLISRAPSMIPVARLVRSTRERWDGGGYPDGLKGIEIPLGSRVIAICDTYDELTTDLPYGPCMPHPDAIAMMRNDGGGRLDPGLVELFALVSAG